MKYGQGNLVRLYYTTPQVCEFLQVEPKFLVQLEKEYPEIRVDKNKAGKKIYRHKYFMYLKLATDFIRRGEEQATIHEILSQAPRSGLDEWVDRQLSKPQSPFNEPVQPSIAQDHPTPSKGLAFDEICQEIQEILALLRS